MEKDKRPFYIWLIVILANIGTYFVITIMEIYDSDSSVFTALLAPVQGDYLKLMGISMFVSILPVWISQSNIVHKKRLVFGILTLLLLPIPFIVFYAVTCNESLCGLIIILAFILGLMALLFSLFYAIGIYFVKWNVKFAISLLWIESVLLSGAIVFFGYSFYQDLSLSSPSVATCDEVRESRMGECWTAVIKANPTVNVCSFAKKENSKKTCLSSYEDLSYRDIDDCEYDLDTDMGAAYRQTKDPIEYAKLTACWADKAKKYPEIDICGWSKPFNAKECVDFFKTISPEEKGVSGKIILEP